jgi:outer membrane immunogenic protein
MGRVSSRRMSDLRTGLAALALILAAPAGALAADMPEFLRGSYTPTYTRWEGFYFGAQGGETFGSANFGNATQSMVSYMLANTELQSIVSSWTTLPKGSSSGASFGGFIGYNWQWDDVVLGAELNYNHMSIGIGSKDSVGPILVPGANLPDGSTVLYNVTLTSSASVSIHDIVTARARAGWTFDRFMPYGFAGLAVGRADTSAMATLAGSTKTVTSPAAPPVITTGPLILPRDPQTNNLEGVIVYGYTAGLGIDALVMQNLFVRAEWEFVEFPNVSNFRVSANSARAAVGLKF